MSGTKRRSTVHDLASLRLHPDGTKVANAETNLQPRKAKYATQDARGNWIAQDAGGLGRVKTRRVAGKEKQGAGSEDEGGTAEAGPSSSVAEKGKARATEHQHEENSDDSDDIASTDARAKRRRAFQDDLSFLDSQHVTRAHSVVVPAEDAEAASGPSHQLPQPSSDLLKCIHHFASTYYTEMGQLRDSTREYRRERKRRRLEKLQTATTFKVTELRKEEVVSGDVADEDDESSPSSEEEEEEEEHSNKQTSKSARGTCRRKRTRRHGKTHIGIDMYKVCDGSALMAVGMLLQHYIADSLSTRIPEGWEDAMQESGQLVPTPCSDSEPNQNLTEEEEEAMMSTEYEDEGEEHISDDEWDP